MDSEMFMLCAPAHLQLPHAAPRLRMSHRDPVSASKRGSGAVLVVPGLCGTDDASLEQVELPAAIHLAFDELEFCDLSLGLAV